MTKVEDDNKYFLLFVVYRPVKIMWVRDTMIKWTLIDDVFYISRQKC